MFRVNAVILLSRCQEYAKSRALSALRAHVPACPNFCVPISSRAQTKFTRAQFFACPNFCVPKFPRAQFFMETLWKIFFIRWCIGVIYYTNTTNRTDTLAPMDTPRSQLPCHALNYSFTGYTRTCLYWDKEEKTWSGKGCEVNLLLLFLHF